MKAMDVPESTEGSGAQGVALLLESLHDDRTSRKGSA